MARPEEYLSTDLSTADAQQHSILQGSFFSSCAAVRVTYLPAIFARSHVYPPVGMRDSYWDWLGIDTEADFR